MVNSKEESFSEEVNDSGLSDDDSSAFIDPFSEETLPEYYELINEMRAESGREKGDFEYLVFLSCFDVFGLLLPRRLQQFCRGPTDHGTQVTTGARGGGGG